MEILNRDLDVSNLRTSTILQDKDSQNYKARTGTLNSLTVFFLSLTHLQNRGIISRSYLHSHAPHFNQGTWWFASWVPVDIEAGRLQGRSETSELQYDSTACFELTSDFLKNMLTDFLVPQSWFPRKLTWRKKGTTIRDEMTHHVFVDAVSGISCRRTSIGYPALYDLPSTKEQILQLMYYGQTSKYIRSSESWVKRVEKGYSTTFPPITRCYVDQTPDEQTIKTDIEILSSLFWGD